MLVAYSLGARITLQMLADGSLSPHKTVLISATAGLEETDERRARAASDDNLAMQLRRIGLRNFTDKWYQAEMWRDLVAHPRYSRLTATS